MGLAHEPQEAELAVEPHQHDVEDAVAIVTIEGEGEPVAPADVEELLRDAGALVARVNDRREIEADGGRKERDWRWRYRSLAYRLVKNYGLRPGVAYRLCRHAGTDAVEGLRGVASGDRSPSTWFASGREVQVVGVSKSGPRLHRGFIQLLDLNFPLYTDPDMAVGRAYDVSYRAFGLFERPRRSCFLIDSDRRIRYTWIADHWLDPTRDTPPVGEIHDAIREELGDPDTEQFGMGGF